MHPQNKLIKSQNKKLILNKMSTALKKLAKLLMYIGETEL